MCVTSTQGKALSRLTPGLAGPVVCRVGSLQEVPAVTSSGGLVHFVHWRLIKASAVVPVLQCIARGNVI
jgi:hypothetical protein